MTQVSWRRRRVPAGQTVADALARGHATGKPRASCAPILRASAAQANYGNS
ncbi:hypothetical protein [Cupriavidus taiwanensis]|uniref:hypothetical protein n=1 Tax=Cupriavidus taiwanensis TaxID=164546 RepID=UPI0015F252DB|nr:hypothetical protein [Cupriavidus taiwanensis]